MMARMNIVLLVLDERDLLAIPYASAIARSVGQSMLVVCLSKETRTRLDTVESLTESHPEIVRRTVEVLNAAEGTNPEVLDCRGPRVRRVLIDACVDRETQQLIVPFDLTQRGSGSMGMKRQIARSAPFDVLAIDIATDEDGTTKLPERVLVPQIRGGGASAITYAAKHFSGEDTVVCAVADASAAPRSRRVYSKSCEKVHESKRSHLIQLEPPGSIQEALADEISTGDMLLVSVDTASQLKQSLALLSSVRGSENGRQSTLSVLREANAAGPGRFERWFERLRMHAPTLSRDQRRDLYEMLDRGGRLSTEFVVMMMLSTAIASLGLIQSSTAVVIGAMLVAPLMTPLVAIGMALVQGNTRLFQQAGKSMLTGIVGALLVSMGIALLSPWSELSSEILARGGPNVFDLGIALLSGVAAAFALARPGLAGTLVGVAIAVALVPPLASIGIATIKGHFDVALGAGVLFTTNLFAIVVGAAMVFRFFGLDASLKGSRAPEWVRLVLLLIAIGLLPITGTLVHNLVGQIHQGVHRPYARPLPKSLREAIIARVDLEPGFEVMMMMQSEIETDFGIEITLLCVDEANTELRDDLIRLVQDTFGTDMAVRVFQLRGAEGASP